MFDIHDSFPPVPDGFDEFWAIYPKQIERMNAIIAYQRAVVKTDKEVINEGAKQYAKYNKKTEDKYLTSPYNRLSQERRTDVYKTTQSVQIVEEERIQMTDEERQRVKDKLHRLKMALLSKQKGGQGQM